MSVIHDPLLGDAAVPMSPWLQSQSPHNAAPQSVSASRIGASLQFDIGDGRVACVVRVADQMRGRLLAWARDPDLYAAVIRASAATTRSPQLARGSADVVPSALNSAAWELDCFAKPLVTLLPPSPSSAALAIALAGTHRVAPAAFALAIDDVGRGEIPPGMVVHSLSRLPAGVGAYLMLSGCIIGAADAYELGLITHCIADEYFDDIAARLADADPVDPVLDDRHAITTTSALAPLLGLLAQHFTGATVVDIVASLERETGLHRMWAAAVAVQISGAPAVTADLALTVLARARTHDARETTILAARANVLLDEPSAHRRDAKTLIERLDTPLATDLQLPTRAELQSLRRQA